MLEAAQEDLSTARQLLSDQTVMLAEKNKAMMDNSTSLGILQASEAELQKRNDRQAQILEQYTNELGDRKVKIEDLQAENNKLTERTKRQTDRLMDQADSLADHRARLAIYERVIAKLVDLPLPPVDNVRVTTTNGEAV